MSNTLDEIILKPAAWKLDDYTKAKQALYQLILTKVIGEDKDVKGGLRANGIMTYDLTASYGNRLRAEQRQTLAKLFNKEKE